MSIYPTCSRSVKLSLHDGTSFPSQEYNSISTMKRAVTQFCIFGILLGMLSPFTLLSKNKEYGV